MRTRVRTRLTESVDDCRMDPRQERSRARLRAAVLGEVADRPLALVTVAAVSRRAEVGRDTFYRHAESTAELLADALRAELEAKVAVLSRFRGSRADLFDRRQAAIIRHISQHAAVYRHAMDPTLAAAVRAMLQGRMEAWLTAYLEAEPEIAPDTPDGLDPIAAERLYIAYAAAGTVGAVERWLLDGAGGEPRRVSQTLLKAAARWWWGEPGSLEAVAASPARRSVGTDETDVHERPRIGKAPEQAMQRREDAAVSPESSARG